MLLHSLLFVTQTHVDSTVLKQLLATAFVRGELSGLATLSRLPEGLSDSFEKVLATGRFLTYAYTSKKDFRESVMDLYVRYEQPTLLYLGDLSDYSEQLQEGMLRLLEEPPHNAAVALTVQNLTQVLPTIRSRVQTLTLKKELVFALLSAPLLQKIKTKLPAPQTALKHLLTGRSLNADLKTVERNEFGLWLWQVQCYLEAYYQQSGELKVAKLLERVLLAQRYNQENVQKKLIFTFLNTGSSK